MLTNCPSITNIAGACSYTRQCINSYTTKLALSAETLMAHLHSDNEDAPLLQPSHPSASATQAVPDHDGFAARRCRYETTIKVVASMYCFVVLGLFSSSIGALIPAIRTHYSLSISQVSALFIPISSGYVIASQCNSYLHARFGQVGVATIGPVLHVISACITAAHPPFSLVLAAFALQGMGTGLLDGSWCAWAGARQNANTVSGLLHGSFSAGAAAGPLFTTMVRKWYRWYHVLVCLLSWFPCLGIST